MKDQIVIWAVGALSVVSVLMWWFNTGLPTHLFEVLRFLGWKRKKAGFWTHTMTLVGKERAIDLKDFSPRDFDEWASERIHPKIIELMNCPGCFSFHVSFWVAATAQCLTGFDPLFFISCVATWPIVGNMLLKTTQG